MLIYLIRHAQPQGAEGLCYGRRNILVSQQETRYAARALRAQLLPELLEQAAIHTSPLSRCTALANELAPERGAVIAPELVELDFGSWEGRDWDDVPRAELDAWAADPWGYAPGGGESAQVALLRLQSWARRLEDEGNTSVIAVTHAGIIRLALAAGSADASRLSLSIPYGSMHPIVTGRPVGASSHPQRAQL